MLLGRGVQSEALGMLITLPKRLFERNPAKTSEKSALRESLHLQRMSVPHSAHSNKRSYSQGSKPKSLEIAPDAGSREYWDSSRRYCWNCTSRWGRMSVKSSAYWSAVRFAIQVFLKVV